MSSNKDCISNILVAIRVRPLLPKEISREDVEIVHIDGKFIVVLDPIDIKLGRKAGMDIMHRSKEKQ